MANRKRFVWFTLVVAVVTVVCLMCDIPSPRVSSILQVFPTKPSYGKRPMVICNASERNSVQTKYCKEVPSRSSFSYGQISLAVLRNILVDDKRKVLLCAIPRAASSSWKLLLMNATGKVTRLKNISIQDIHNRDAIKKHGLDVLSNFNSNQIARRLRTYYKIMTIRHPFDRLESTYRAKFTMDNSYYESNFGTVIIKKFRVRASAESLKRGHDVTFSEFTDYLITTNERYMDIHWSPYENVCDPCTIQYDYITRQETLPADTKFILPKLTQEMNVNFPTRNILNEVNSHVSKKLDLFAKLPTSKIRILKQIYKRDFQLFGYSFTNDSTTICRNIIGGHECC